MQALFHFQGKISGRCGTRSSGVFHPRTAPVVGSERVDHRLLRDAGRPFGPHQHADLAHEFLGTRHWWKNASAQPVDLTIADIVNDRKPETRK